MFGLQTTRSIPLGAVTTLRVVNIVERVIDAARSWYSARATAVALAELSDSQLSDIGLHRGDIPDVAEALARR